MLTGHQLRLQLLSTLVLFDVTQKLTTVDILQIYVGKSGIFTLNRALKKSILVFEY